MLFNRMCVVSDLEQSYFQCDENRINQVSSYTYLGPLVDDDAIKLNILKAKKQLLMPRPILMSKILPIKSRVKLLKTFLEPVLY